MKKTIKIKKTFLIPREFAPDISELTSHGTLVAEHPTLAGPIYRYKGKYYMLARGEVLGVELK